MAFMLNRKIITPKSFQERDCRLVSYQLPLLKHCFVLCADHQTDQIDHQVNYQTDYQINYHAQTQNELMVFFIEEAEKLAEKITGNSQCYLIAFSGNQVRKRPNLHIHLFIIETRWQKAMVYSMLAGKNWAQLIWEMLEGMKR